MNEQADEIKLESYVPEAAEELVKQLASDHERWGNTWWYRPREGQEGRAFATFDNYRDQFEHAGVAMPWLKVMGGALIAWARENYPGALLTPGEMAPNDIRLVSYVPGFAELLKAQLASDDIYYGGTWRHSFRGGWVRQCFDYLETYRGYFFNFGEAVPWLKVAALAVIGWMRETHPETLCQIRTAQDE